MSPIDTTRKSLDNLDHMNGEAFDREVICELRSFTPQVWNAGLTHLQRFWWSLSCRSMKLLYRASLKVTPRSTAHTTYGLICLVCPSTRRHQLWPREEQSQRTHHQTPEWYYDWTTLIPLNPQFVLTSTHTSSDIHRSLYRVDNTPQVSQPFFALNLSAYPQQNLELDLFQWRPAAPLPDPPDITSRNWKWNIACQSSIHLYHTLL